MLHSVPYKGFEVREQQIADAAGSWRRQLDAIAEAENASALEMSKRCTQLQDDARQRKVELTNLKRRRRDLDGLLSDIDSSMWGVVARAGDRVPLEVGGQYFMASARTLKTSPWFARELGIVCHDTEAACSGLSHTRPLICIERDPEKFRMVLNCLRMGPNYLRSLASFCTDAKSVRDLLEELAFFELHDLSGLLAVPSIGTKVEVRISSAALHSSGIVENLLHEACGTWHVPGRCFSPACRRRGLARIQGIIRSYTHLEPDAVWDVVCDGCLFKIKRVDILSDSRSGTMY